MKAILIFSFSFCLLITSSAWSFDFKKCIEGLSLFGRAKAIHAEGNTHDDRRDIPEASTSNKFTALDATLNEFAQLVVDLQNGDHEVASYSIRSKMVQEKDAQIGALLNTSGFNEEDKEYVKDLVALKVATLREGRELLSAEDTERERVARRDERFLLFGPEIQLRELISTQNENDEHQLDLGFDGNYVHLPQGKDVVEFSNAIDGSVTRHNGTSRGTSKNKVLQMKFISGGAQFVVAREFEIKNKRYFSFDVLDSKSQKLVYQRQIKLPKIESHLSIKFHKLKMITDDGVAILDENDSKNIFIYDIGSNKKLRIRPKDKSSNSFRFTDDGKFISYLGNERPTQDQSDLQIWNLKSGGFLGLNRTFRKLKLNINAHDVRDYAFDANRNRVITIDKYQKLKVWSLKDGREVQNINLSAAYTSMSLDSEGRIILSVENGLGLGEKKNYPILLVDLDHREESKSGVIMLDHDYSIRTLQAKAPEGGIAFPTETKLSPDGKWLAAIVGKENYLWDLAVWYLPTRTLKAQEPIFNTPTTFFSQSVQDLDWSPDGDFLAVRMQRDSMIWKVEKEK